MARASKEIITLQFGNYSNFIGAHLWNLQEAGFEYNAVSPSEIDHDILFREGQTPSGEITFTPRLLLVDLKGSLRTLPETSKLYATPGTAPTPLWDPAKIEVIQAPADEKNRFLFDLDREQYQTHDSTESAGDDPHTTCKLYDLDNDVSSWSDYLRPYLHPRSINLVHEYQHNSQESPFGSFHQGLALWETFQFKDDFADKIRRYLEESDNPQGFHMLFDGVDGFSGLAVACLQHLRDEYPSKAVFTLPALPPHLSALHPFLRPLNLTLCLSALSDQCSLFVPISTSFEGWLDTGPPRCFPHLNYNSDLAYHTSAVLASALETVTLQYRLKESPWRLHNVASSLTVVGRTGAAASLALPFPLGCGQTLLQALEEWDGPLTTSLTPRCSLATSQIQTLVMRGIPQHRLLGEMDSHVDRSNPAYHCRDAGQLLRYYLSCSAAAAQSSVSAYERPLRMAASFPHMFAPSVLHNGDVDTSTHRTPHTGVQQVPVLAGLHSCQEFGEMLIGLEREARSIDVRRLPHLASLGFEKCEWREALEQLLQLADCYSDQQKL